MGSSLLQTLKGRGRRAVNQLHGVVVFTSTIGAAFVALLLESLLCLGIGEAKQQFDTIFALNVVEFVDDNLRIFAGFESGEKGKQSACLTRMV